MFATTALIKVAASPALQRAFSDICGEGHRYSQQGFSVKNLEDFDSIDELKKAISHLTQKYEQLKHDERATKIAEVRDIIENYELTAEELGFGHATPLKKPAIQKTIVRRKLSAASDEQTPNSGQQGLW